nr:C4-dicarboxylate anaerobic carrier [Klebsiella pneumoniae]
MPHCYALIFFIIILVALLTWCIPSGSFDYHSVTLPGGETKTLVIRVLSSAGQSQQRGRFTSGYCRRTGRADGGIIKAADVVAFVLIVGGAFGIILRTGAIERGLVALAERPAGKGILVIPIAMTLFSPGGATFGMSEEVIPCMRSLSP